jgi:hypothetical protein
MRTMLAVASVAATLGFLGCDSAGAIPAAPTAVSEAPTAAPQPIQFRARRTRHGVVKCYRELVVGPYRCHHFRRRWW